MWGYRTTETAQGLPSLLQHIYLRSFQYIYLNFVHSTVTRKWKLLFVFGYTCIGSKCKVVSRWPKCINVPGDALGMNGLQVRESGLERSGLLENEAVSLCQVFWNVGQYFLRVQGTKCRPTYTASCHRNLKSRYVNTPCLGHPHVFNCFPVAVLNNQATVNSPVATLARSKL